MSEKLSRKSYKSKWERGKKIQDRCNIDDPFISGMITGFTMGEGSFNIVVRKSKTIKVGIQITPVYQINLKKDDAEILRSFKNLFGCGRIRMGNDFVEYKVQKFEDLVEIIIPFFTQYPLKNIKQKDFCLFKIVCYKLMQGEGRHYTGIKRIMSVRNIMNNGGTATRKTPEVIGGYG